MNTSKRVGFLLLIAFLAVGFFALLQFSDAATEVDSKEDADTAKQGKSEHTVETGSKSPGEAEDESTPAGEKKPSSVTITQPKQTVFYHGPENSKRVALTFDDGPHPIYTPMVLDILKQRKVRATFFVIGSQAKRYPHLVQRIVDEGHVIANHSWQHPDLTRRSPEEVQRELAETNATIAKATGRLPTLMRPPYGSLNPQVQGQLEEMGFKAILWSVDTRDWERIPPAEIMTKVRMQTRPGGIILLHDGGGHREHTVRALPHIISYLEGQGYQLVTVPELLNVPAYHYSPLQ